MKRTILAVLACLAMGTAQAVEIKIATFNTESDTDTQPAKVAETIRKVAGVDIWAFQEVEGEDALKVYREAAKTSPVEHWRYVISESGPYNDPGRKPDYVGIAYRTDLFRQIETIELHGIRSTPDGSKYGKPDWGLRGALFVRLALIGSNAEFYVGTVHLKCCGEGEATRDHQAGLLAAWIKKADVPVILLGDTNIPIEPGQKASDVTSAAFRKLVNDAGLVWIEPSNPFKTQCHATFNSMLDQVYRTPNLPVTAATAEIQFTSPQYCERDVEGFSDHRPVVATFMFK